MICPTCTGPMRPLFTGFFCPKDCDRKPQSKQREAVFTFIWLDHASKAITYSVYKYLKGERVPEGKVYGISDPGHPAGGREGVYQRLQVYIKQSTPGWTITPGFTLQEDAWIFIPKEA